MSRRELVTETRDKRNMELWAEQDIDPDSLDPNFHYRVISDRPARIARARTQGYTPAKYVRRLSDKQELIVPGNGSEEGAEESDAVGADGLIRLGDGILMACPKQVFEERERKQTNMKRARLAAPEGSFRKRAKEASAGLSKQIQVDSKE